MNGLEKGQFIVEPSFGISDFIEKINKLSFKDFPVLEVLRVLQDSELPLELLEPYIFFSDTRYTRNLIHKTDSFEILLLCWRPGQYSAIHGHEDQKCWMRVEKGELEFTQYQEEPRGESTLLKKISTEIGKEGFVDGPALVHKVANISQSQAISLHVYSKPFEQCDIYDLDMNEKKRLMLSYHSIHGKLVVAEK